MKGYITQTEDQAAHGDAVYTTAPIAELSRPVEFPPEVEDVFGGRGPLNALGVPIGSGRPIHTVFVAAGRVIGCSTRPLAD